MTDIALIWNVDQGVADFAIANGDLVLDQGLHTAVIVSLFSDRLADPSDSIPDGTTDRRGWVGDAPRADIDAAPDPIGSRLWLYEGQRQTEPIRVQIEAAVRDALAWMIQDGVADRIDVTVDYPFRDRVGVVVVVHQGDAEHRWDLHWKHS